MCGRFPSLTSYVYPDLKLSDVGQLVTFIGQSKGCSGTKDKISRPTHLLRSCESPLDGRLVDHPVQSQAVVNVEEERFPLKTNKCCIFSRLSDTGPSSPSTEVKLHLVFGKQRWIMVDQKASCLHVVLELEETSE